MSARLWIPAVLTLAVAGGFLATGCGDEGGKRAGSARQAPAAPLTDTKATALAAFQAFFRPTTDRIPHALDEPRPAVGRLRRQPAAPCATGKTTRAGATRSTAGRSTTWPTRPCSRTSSGATTFQEAPFKWKFKPRRTSDGWVIDAEDNPGGTVGDTYGLGTPTRRRARSRCTTPSATVATSPT